MGLITKEIEINLTNGVVKYYENLGYKIPREKNKYGKLVVLQNTKLLIKIEDLPNKSWNFVEVKCDNENCKHNNPNLKPMNYYIYKRYVREDGKYYCYECAMKLFAKEKTRQTKLKNGVTFKQWCNDNSRLKILNLWDYNINKCNPEDILYGTPEKYWFKCPRGIHNSELKNINQFTNNEGEIICRQCNSIGQFVIDNFGKDFLERCLSNDNIIDPFEISYGSKETIFWKCPDGIHKDFPRTISASSIYNFRCPDCVRERDESFLQEKVRLYLNEEKYDLRHEYNCNLIPINPKTKQRFLYDNEVVKLKFIIEVHGSQHYKICSFHKKHAKRNGTTPEYELRYQKLKDRYKRIFAKSRGYFYVEIPYWMDNKNEDWKKMIDSKIDEILNQEALSQVASF